MIQIEYGLAFLIGLVGSVHCLGMCSGFTLAVTKGGGRRYLPFQTLYTTGRLSSYMVLGLVAGTLGETIGKLIPLHIVQNSLSVIAGVLMIMAGLRMSGVWPVMNAAHSRLTLNRQPFKTPSGKLQSAGSFLEKSIRTLWPPAGFAQAFYLGLLNGLLPCPVVYAMLPAAIAMRSGPQGGLLMVVMGAGTIPMMLSIGIAGRVLIAPVQKLARIPGLVILPFGFVTVSRAFLIQGHGLMPMP